ncbi:hypothetical protein OIU79_011362 [Salix purpurea]|uniref:Uncharacterized protein n=1 Tax=Salix purpurea TaxID=77065 RepID=A0A9Q0Q142_SALPP|nr:hypothetical protein OIU79_011362 [Salix purpurea]
MDTLPSPERDQTPSCCWRCLFPLTLTVDAKWARARSNGEESPKRQEKTVKAGLVSFMGELELQLRKEARERHCANKQCRVEGSGTRLHAPEQKSLENVETRRVLWQRHLKKVNEIDSRGHIEEASYKTGPGFG